MDNNNQPIQSSSSKKSFIKYYRLLSLKKGKMHFYFVSTAVSAFYILDKMMLTLVLLLLEKFIKRNSQMIWEQSALVRYNLF